MIDFEKTTIADDGSPLHKPVWLARGFNFNLRLTVYEEFPGVWGGTAWFVNGTNRYPLIRSFGREGWSREETQKALVREARERIRQIANYLDRVLDN